MSDDTHAKGAAVISTDKTGGDTAPVPEVHETKLVGRARPGDLTAYDELVRRYQERIYATVYHMTANHEDANDLAQEAFIKAYQDLSHDLTEVYIASFNKVGVYLFIIVLLYLI